MRILIIHGPNMNLLGVRSAETGSRITLDKVNAALRRAVRKQDAELKIFQTNSEADAVTLLQRNRSRSDAIIVSPEAWHHAGFVLKDTLELLKLPCIIVSTRPRETSIFTGYETVIDENPIQSYLTALEKTLS